MVILCNRAIFKDPLEFCRAIEGRLRNKQATAATKKLCGLDLSPTRIGIAISDSQRQLALPFAVLRNSHVGRTRFIHGFGLRPGEESTVKRLGQEQIIGWVVGWPLSLESDKQERYYRLGETLRMIDNLPRLFAMDLNPILLHDERFSSVMARVQASEMSAMQMATTGGLDALAAANILQEYLDFASRSHTLLSGQGRTPVDFK